MRQVKDEYFFLQIFVLMSSNYRREHMNGGGIILTDGSIVSGGSCGGY